MAIKPVKGLEMHYLMTQFLIMGTLKYTLQANKMSTVG